MITKNDATRNRGASLNRKFYFLQKYDFSSIDQLIRIFSNR